MLLGGSRLGDFCLVSSGLDDGGLPERYEVYRQEQGDVKLVCEGICQYVGACFENMAQELRMHLTF